MISNKDFVSNCKRIARVLSIDSNRVEVSGTLIDNFNREGVDRYIEEINKHLSDFSVSYKTHGFNGSWFIEFNIFKK